MKNLLRFTFQAILLSSLTSAPAFAGRGTGNIEIEAVSTWEGKEILFFYSQT